MAKTRTKRRALGLMAAGVAIAAPGVALAQTDAPATGDPLPIHAVQGPGDSTPLAGQTVTIEAVVTANFADTMGGIFVQQPDGAHDDDPRTSEGLYLFNRGEFPRLAPGDKIQVTGTATEHHGMTQLSQLTQIERIGSGTVTPVEVTLPLASPDHWEFYEGMLVTIRQPLTVADTYNLARHGTFTVSGIGRPRVPTTVYPPGDQARVLADLNARATITIDDGSHSANPIPIPHVGTGTVRIGDMVEEITGVVMYAFNNYAIHPTEPVRIRTENPRPEEPPFVAGRLHVAGFNVENYFNGDGEGGDFPTPRGAETFEEFQRQRAKIVNSINAIGADIVGLMEMENDGYGATSALVDLVTGLNETAPEGVEWDFVSGEEDLGDDAIRVAMIYNAATVETVGPRASLHTGAFATDLHRVPLAQTFRERASGETLTVVVNHFKSKRCSGDPTGGNADSGDGQSCWAAARTDAARDLVEWLATDPTSSGNNDVLVIGDLNSYRLEDPLQVFYDAGYVDLHHHFNPGAPGTYVFRGQSGSLDYVLASPSLVPQATGASDWSINADEARYLEYGKAYDSIRPFSDGPERASDHDPIIAGFNLFSREE